MEGGYIKLYRKIRDHWIWQEPEYLKWWIDILLMANHSPAKVLINNKLNIIEPGSFHTSESKLSERWFVNRKSVDKFLTLLKNDEMIVLNKSRSSGTTIKVCNYQAYQAFFDSGEDNETDNNEDKKAAKKPQRKGHKQEPNKLNNNTPFPPEGETDSLKKQKENEQVINIDEYFEKTYSEYPNKSGEKAQGKKLYLQYLTTGKRIKGSPTQKFNHAQMRVAIQEYSADSEGADMQFIKEFQNFMKDKMPGYVEKTADKYEAVMAKTYGENWREMKFKYTGMGIDK